MMKIWKGGKVVGVLTDSALPLKLSDSDLRSRFDDWKRNGVEVKGPNHSVQRLRINDAQATVIHEIESMGYVIL